MMAEMLGVRGRNIALTHYLATYPKTLSTGQINESE